VSAAGGGGLRSGERVRQRGSRVSRLHCTGTHSPSKRCAARSATTQSIAHTHTQQPLTFLQKDKGMGEQTKTNRKETERNGCRFGRDGGGLDHWDASAIGWKCGQVQLTTQSDVHSYCAFGTGGRWRDSVILMTGGCLSVLSVWTTDEMANPARLAFFFSLLFSVLFHSQPAV